MSDRPTPPAGQSDKLLFLTEDQLLQGIELMFFAYKGFTSDPDKILSEHGYGRAHHRAVHFINRHDGIKVNALLDILGVTKQSLNRVLRQLIADEMVDIRVGQRDRRERNLHLTKKGKEMEQALSAAQRKRMSKAYRAAGPDAVQGFRIVLENIMDSNMRHHVGK